MVTVGLQRHHEPNYIETVKKIQDGAIGELNYARVFWNSGGVWTKNGLPAKMNSSTRLGTGSTLIGCAETTLWNTHSQHRHHQLDQGLLSYQSEWTWWAPSTGKSCQ